MYKDYDNEKDGSKGKKGVKLSVSEFSHIIEHQLVGKEKVLLLPTF